MSSRTQVTSLPITPIYSQSSPNEAIDFDSIKVRFTTNSGLHDETAAVGMSFLPDAQLKFTLSLEGKSPLFGLRLFDEIGDGKSIEIPARGVAFEAFCSSANGTELTLIPRRSVVDAFPASNEITSATFHLLNFPNFSGPDDCVLVKGNPPQSWQRCGLVVLAACGWKITIAAIAQTDDHSKSLKTQGGYAITHVGKIERDDGTKFSSDRLADVVECLHYFLSFACGRWSAPAFIVGTNANGETVFERWGMGNNSDGAWSGTSSWFDSHHGELLSEVFPGFLALWQQPVWRTPIAHALYWYLGACDRRTGVGVDTGLILAQTALELLAWTVCVEDRRITPPAKFGPHGLSAAAKLQLLTATLKISTDIPPNCPVLISGLGQKWIDSAEAITRIRNSLVHPSIKTVMPDGSYFEAWNLSLWYVDMVFLRLCGHSGNYANRLSKRWAGAVEPVP